MRLTIGCLKGGVGKTTSAVFLATALSADGSRVLLVDADPQSQSAYDWAQLAIGRGYELPFVVLPWATNDLAKRIRGVAGEYDHVVVDVGGENPTMFRLACSVAPDLLIPVSPSEAELRRLPATFEAANEAAQMADTDVIPRILLVKVDTRTADGRASRSFLAQAAEPPLPVLEAQVRDAVLYPRSYGHVPADVGDYAAVLAELRAEVSA